MKNILIVDDHPIFRDALDTALSVGIESEIGTTHCGNISEALAALSGSKFDLVLLDLNMSDSAGFEGLNKIAPHAAHTPIAVVSATESPEAYRKAQTLGAKGFIPKSLPLADLSAALSHLLDGGTSFPDMSQAADTSNDMAARLASLTPAQQKVLAQLADGLLNKQIAYEMGISEATVKAHMTAIFRKLGANNRTQALLLYKDAVAIEEDRG